MSTASLDDLDNALAIVDVEYPTTQDKSVSVAGWPATEFLRSRALGSTEWPPNGLSAHENRGLFRTTDPDGAARLVIKGMLARFTLG